MKIRSGQRLKKEIKGNVTDYYQSYFHGNMGTFNGKQMKTFELNLNSTTGKWWTYWNGGMIHYCSGMLWKCKLVHFLAIYLKQGR